MSKTMPQLIMLNHAAHVNYKRMELRSKRSTKKEEDSSNPQVSATKKYNDMSEKEKDIYLSTWNF